MKGLIDKMTNEYISKIEEAAEYIKSKIAIEPEIGIILGSGLGSLADEVENPTIIDYTDIPNFPESTVQGHAGRMVIGQLQGKNVVVLQGRFHYYEGHPMNSVTMTVRVLKLLGIKALIVTNAAGGINTSFKAGDLMLITDHINFTSVNPLIGPNLDKFGLRFPDMTEAYSKRLIRIAKESANNIGVELKEGVYIYLTGPTFETPAEVRMLRTLGADSVGMSTVPEVIVARHSGLEVLGISCIANPGAGILGTPLTHEEVLAAMEGSKDKFVGLIKETIKNINKK